VRIGGVPADGVDVSDGNLNKLRHLREQNDVRCIDAAAAKKMEKAVLLAKNEGDSLGGIIEVNAFGVPPGLGEPVFDKLGADLAKALMSIPAVKGVEIGAGFRLADMKGSEANDAFLVERGRTTPLRPSGGQEFLRESSYRLRMTPLTKIKTKTNNSGGILGGISSGMPITARVAIKPTSSIAIEQDTVNMKKMQAAKIKVGGRHDPCVVPRAVPVVEAMVALVLADHGIRSGVIPRVLR
jgi:chorismate synthase